MKKNLLRITISLLLVFAIQSVFAQTRDSVIIRLQKNIKQLQTGMENQKTDFSKQLSEANKNIKSLRTEIAVERANFKALADSLGIQIANTQNQAEQQIYGVQQTVSKNTLHWIIAALAIVLLSVILFGLLRFKQKSDKTDIILQLSQTKSAIGESLIKEFGKQTELMNTQMELINQKKTYTQASINFEPDHSMALKVASEINLIERNINLMDTDTKGLKQLVRSMEKLKENLAANGYEIPLMLDKQFHEGMKVIVVNSIPDENLEKGSEVITKILVPQVNYHGKMIQTAQIEVSVGY
jgi:hypothetical protein